MDKFTKKVFQLSINDIMGRSNVVGAGLGFKNNEAGNKSIVVMVEKKLPSRALSYSDIIPFSYRDIRTDVIEVGEIKALAYDGRYRPAPGGVSIGHYMITAGTLGTVVFGNLTGNRYLLSNNHVFANSNDAEIGDAIFQPGPIDGGNISDTIATLREFAPIDFGEEPGSCSIAELYAQFGNWIAGLFVSKHRVKSSRVNPQATNLFDAAIAIPVDQTDIESDILNIGTIDGVLPGFIGMKIRKTGRTTEFTQDKIDLINATDKVSYGGGKIATFTNQYVTGPMSQGGDSGSLVVAEDSTRAVGLLFAGSAQTTIFSPIQPVLDYFNVRFANV